MAELFNLEGLLDNDDFIKKNNLKQITNPIFFNANHQPTSDGLLSNEIFGITKDQRSNTFAYIDLVQPFLHPLAYKIWARLDSKIKEVVHGTNTYRVNENGELEVDPNGKTGIKFIKDNIDKIKIRATDSNKRDRYIEFLEKNKKNMFITSLIVIPAFYRDVNTEAGGKIGVGDINKYYNSVIISVKSLKESQEYGFTMYSSTMGRTQELLLEIYNWFGAGNPNVKTSGVGMPSKHGIIRRANLSKTTDYSARLVLSAPNLKVENIDDLEVDMDNSLVPLAAVATAFYPFVIFFMRRFFENEFSGVNSYNYIDKNKALASVKVKDYQIEFSDTRLKKELDRYIHGFSNRFIPIQVPTYDKSVIFMRFKGYNITKEEYAKADPGMVPLLERDLTWCDIIFMAAVEASKDKMILITRYPIDSYYNQFPTRVKVASTILTEPMVYNTTFIKSYPKIRQSDINGDTSNKFVDTLNICNAYLASIGGDYDGDQVTVKGIYSKEANAELDAQLHSKSHFINLGGQNIMGITNEGVQSLYNLTLVLPDVKLSDPSFKNVIM